MKSDYFAWTINRSLSNKPWLPWETLRNQSCHCGRCRLHRTMLWVLCCRTQVLAVDFHRGTLQKSKYAIRRRPLFEMPWTSKKKLPWALYLIQYDAIMCPHAGNAEIIIIHEHDHKLMVQGDTHWAHNLSLVQLIRNININQFSWKSGRKLYMLFTLSADHHSNN